MRVFISHTAELRQYPASGKSYIDAAERTISRAGHVIVNMADFPSTEDPPADECIRRVRSCDVYLGVLGARYGSPVRDHPEVSYTELEYETATKSGIPRLIFVIDMNADDLGIPLKDLIDRQYGDRQDAFRDRLTGMAQRFASPHHLALLVSDSLQHEEERQAEEASKRIDEDLEKERRPPSQPAVRASKFINQPPLTAPTWFQDRVVETGLVADWLADSSTRMITVAGRGGIGKTAMVCRLLKGLEAGRIPDVTGEVATMSVGGIVYLSPTGNHRVTYPNLINDLCKLLPPGAAQVVQSHYQNPHNSPQQVMLALLEGLPADGGPFIVLLDHLESVLDTKYGCLAEEALQEALETVLRAPAHPLKILITTRVAPSRLLEIEPATQQQRWLEEGLSPSDARVVLRALDSGGTLGLRDAPDELLDELREHTRGFPRALEVLKGILAANYPNLSPTDVLDRIRYLPEDRAVESLVGQAYQSLDAPAQQVMQVLAVFPTPVAAVAVDFLLQPYDPTVNTTPILKRLVRWQLVRHDAGQYYLHPVDRDYARDQIPRATPDGAEPTYTLAGLQARAADYYAQIRMPRETWCSLDDVRPQLAEFHLRCDIGDYDTAVEVLADIEFDYLRVWGHYRTLLGMHTRIHGHLIDPAQQISHLINMGNCHRALGDYPQAVDLYTQAHIITREIGNRAGEAAALTVLGNSHSDQGNYVQAIELHTQALAIDREIGDRAREAVHLSNLGTRHANLGKYSQAISLYIEALDIDRQIGDLEGEASDLANLGNCHHDLGDYSQALGLCEQALAIARDIDARYLEAVVLQLMARIRTRGNNPKSAVSLFEKAVGIGDAIGHSQIVVEGRSWLAQVRLELGEVAAVLPLTETARALNLPTEQPRLWLLEGIALLALGQSQQAQQALLEAERGSDTLLALAPTNVTALTVHALACYGLALTGAPQRVDEVIRDLVQLRAATNNAAGILADVEALLMVLAAHDPDEILEPVRAALHEEAQP